MPPITLTRIASIIAVFAALTVSHAVASPPQLQTPSPVIYLADNLDEKDQLGWCIDTMGRGFSEKLHAHSCKPRGGDVQFSHDTKSGQIRSVAFAGKCMALNSPDDRKVPFGLIDCVEGEPSQQFSYDQVTGQIHLRDDQTMCVSVGDGSRSAGPFMSRDLKLTSCANTEAKMLKWLIKDQ